jgi:GTP pyrophosphokinase
MVRRFEDIVERVERNNPDADLDLLRRAYVFSAHEHRHQKRRSGEPYLIHCLEVAYLLAELNLDIASIASGLLHDVVEDTLTTIERVEEMFGSDVAHIVAGVTKISKIKFASEHVAQAENLRRMILAMVDDIRVILVKLCDRLHNMRTLEHLIPEKQLRIARETREIYAPLANRLGIGRFKAELDDLAFRYLEIEAHQSLTRAFESRRKIRDSFIDEISERLSSAMKEAGIESKITGRAKSYSSIYQKMKVQKIGVDQVYDYIAFRIIADSVKDCYGAMGIVHSIWRPVPGRIKDYIAIPKANMYQSLHTSVMTERGQPFEVQIRTEEMHNVAEEGIAAHWQYKEKDAASSGQDMEKMAWLRQIMEWQNEMEDAEDFLELVKVDLFPEEVYAFTPKGKVLPFRNGATPIDFAYAVHTEVGHHTSGAKINGKIVPLGYTLQNGDIVEILTQPNRHPNRDWLSVARTSRARSKIRAWLNANERKSSVAIGKELTDKEFRKYKLSIKSFKGDDRLDGALKKLGLSTLDDFYAGVGYGKFAPKSLVAALMPEEELAIKPEGVVTRVVRRALGRGDRGIQVRGMDEMMVQLAQCCHPVRGEQIVGYITRGKGVSVHSVDCPNVTQLMFDSERKIDVEWSSEVDGSSLFDVKLALDVEDRQGLLAKIVSAVSELKTNIKNVEAVTFDTDDARIHMIVSVADRKQMDRVISRIKKLSGVRGVERVLS